MVKPFLYLLTVFLAGAVAALNLSRLMPTNPDYVAAWWKVGLAIAVAVFFGHKALRRSTDE